MLIMGRNLFFALVLLHFRDQIGINAEQRKQDRLDYLEEGRKVRQRIEDERLKVERIKG